MKIQEIKEHLLPEDKAIAAVKCECSIVTVRAMLRNARNHETKLGKKIMAELERLAKVNIQSRLKKQTI